MIFVNFATYIADQDKVARVRPKHREFLSPLLAEGKVVGAGPFTDGGGTLIIYDVESLEAVQAILAEDPFTTNGVYASCEIRGWKIVYSKVDALVPRG